MRFMCKNCDYRFDSELDQRGKKCPYCGRIEVSKELNAEELLEGE